MHVPQYKGLKIEETLQFTERRDYMKINLSVCAYEKISNRVWLCNLANSLFQEDFAAFVAEKIKNKAKFNKII